MQDGINDVKSIAERLSNSMKDLGNNLERAFTGKAGKVQDLANKIQLTEDKIRQAAKELDSMANTDFHSTEFTKMTEQIEKTEAALINLLNEREKLEEATKTEMDSVGLPYTEKALQDTIESKKQWQELSQKIEQAERNLAGYEEKLRSISHADASYDAKDTDKYKKKQMQLDALLLQYQKYRNNLNQVNQAETKNAKETDKAEKSVKKKSNTVGKANKSTKKYNKTLSMLGKSLMFSMVFRAFNTAMNGIKEGMQNLSKYSTETNKTLSAFATSSLLLKNSLATAFSPIMTAIAPALTSLINHLSSAITVMGQFFAVLMNGATTFTRAKIAQKDYAQSLKDTAKEANKTLSPIDELNNVSDSKSTVDLADMFEEVTIEGKIADTANGFKDLLSDIFEPIKTSWDKHGKTTTDAFKYALDSIKIVASDVGTTFKSIWTGGTGEITITKLQQLLTVILKTVGDIGIAFKGAWDNHGTATVQSVFNLLNSVLGVIITIGESFRTVWNNGTGETLISNILIIFTNINETIKNIANNFKTAWVMDDTGTQILQGIMNIINLIFDGIKRMSEATKVWASTLDFSPILTSFQNLISAIEPLTGNIADGLVWFYTNVLLPLAGWVITDLLPVFLDTLAAALKVINEVIEVLKPLALWLFDKFLLPIAQWTGGLIVGILGQLVNALESFANWCKDHQKTVQVITVTVLGFMAAWEITKLMSFIQQSGGVVAALSRITTALFSATAAKIADKAETVILTAMYAKDFVVSVASSTAALIKQAAQWVINTALKIADTVATIAMTAATVAWNAVCTIATAVTTAFGAAIAFLTSPIGLIILAVGALIAIIVLLVKNWDTVKEFAIKCWEGIKNVWNNVADWFNSKVIKPLANFFTGMWNGIKKGVTDALDNVKRVFKTVFDALIYIVKAPINAIIDIINGMVGGIVKGINTVIKAINSISFKMPDWVPGVGGKSVGFNLKEVSEVKIPRLATGTVVPANYGEFTAILGDNKRAPEVVSPVPTLKQAFREVLGEFGGIGGGEYTFIAQMNGKTVFEETVTQDKLHKKQTGRSAFGY